MSAKRLNISMNDRLVREMDTVAEALDMTRSALIAAAVRAHTEDLFRRSSRVRSAISRAQEEGKL